MPVRSCAVPVSYTHLILIGYFYFLVLEIGRLIARLVTLQQIGFIKLSGFRYTAVSYTHLDVYKRQAFTCSGLAEVVMSQSSGHLPRMESRTQPPTT